MPTTERICLTAAGRHPGGRCRGVLTPHGMDDRASVLARTLRARSFSDRVVAQGGRIVDMAGDSVLLAIFDSAVGALRAALEAQQRLAAADLGVTPSERMRFRIGDILGDVIENDDGTGLRRWRQHRCSPGGARIAWRGRRFPVDRGLDQPSADTCASWTSARSRSRTLRSRSGPFDASR